MNYTAEAESTWEQPRNTIGEKLKNNKVGLPYFNKDAEGSKLAELNCKRDVAHAP